MEILPQNTQQPYAAEMPVELWINHKKLTTFLCTPYDLEDLAVGHLLTRGYITSLDDIMQLHADKLRSVIEVTTTTGTKQSLYSVSEIILSGCSAVSDFTEQIYKLPPVCSDYTVSVSKITELGHYMISHGEIYQSTGGVHAALLDTSSKRFVREDIGRHNAVDKVIGAAIRNGCSPAHSVLVTTGRISLDMTLKAAAAAVPVIATLKCPSDLGIRLAEHYHICIAARILSGSPLIYTAREKIIHE